MSLNRLKNMTVYLAGNMEGLEDNGVGWREEITPTLEKEFGLIVYNPCNKPSSEKEDKDLQIKLNQLKKEEKYDEISSYRRIRAIDLRLVDKSDLIIASVDMEKRLFGTIEEISWANRQKRPILIWARNGKQAMSAWLFWMVEHKYIFNTMDEIISYLRKVNDGLEDDSKRWIFWE